MHNGDKIVFVGISVLISVLFGFFVLGFTSDFKEVQHSSHYGLQKLRVGGTPLFVELAQTSDERVRGLSDRKQIPATNGMLFIFDADGIYPIWMRHMNFSLDVYWISSDGLIVDIWKNARPESYPSIFTPKHKARYVLEVVSGFSEVYNISVGDTVEGLHK